jgi:hypothetical protein
MAPLRSIVARRLCQCPLVDGQFELSCDRTWPGGACGVGGDRQRVLPDPYAPFATGRFASV